MVSQSDEVGKEERSDEGGAESDVRPSIVKMYRKAEGKRGPGCKCWIGGACFARGHPQELDGSTSHWRQLKKEDIDSCTHVTAPSKTLAKIPSSAYATNLMAVS